MDCCKQCGVAEDRLTEGLCKACVKRILESHSQVQSQQQQQHRPTKDGEDPERLVLAEREGGRPSVSVDKELVSDLKPHQKEGVEFIWKNCFSDFVGGDESEVGGCILAHHMGLGKFISLLACRIDPVSLLSAVALLVRPSVELTFSSYV